MTNKNVSSLIVGLALGVIIFNITSRLYPKQHNCGAILHEAENAPLDEYWRRITGYDSIQVYNSLFAKSGIEVNFCFPNEWEREKYKKDTISIAERAGKSMPREWYFQGQTYAYDPLSVDSVIVYNMQLCVWPVIDWNWFKKGYTPVFVTSVNGRSGDYIIGDTVFVDIRDEYEFETIHFMPLKEAKRRGFTFRDTINDLSR